MTEQEDRVCVCVCVCVCVNEHMNVYRHSSKKITSATWSETKLFIPQTKILSVRV